MFCSLRNWQGVGTPQTDNRVATAVLSLLLLLLSYFFNAIIYINTLLLGVLSTSTWRQTIVLSWGKKSLVYTRALAYSCTISLHCCRPRDFTLCYYYYFYYYYHYYYYYYHCMIALYLVTQRT